MSFFTTTPRFTGGYVANGTFINTREKKKDMRASTYSTMTLRKQIPITPQKSFSPSSLNRPATSPTSSFGTSLRSTPLSKSNGGFVFVPASSEKPMNTKKDIGPGSYTDSHYRGSPDVCASQMLHTSFNVKSKNGNKHEPSPSSVSIDHDEAWAHCLSVGNNNIRTPKSSQRKKRIKHKTFSKPYEEFLASEDALGMLSIDTNDESNPQRRNKKQANSFKPANPNPVASRPHTNDLWNQSRQLSAGIRV